VGDGNAIEAVDLRKSYGEDVQALDGLTFSVPAGTVFGLLGPNGAGKSTTVNILTGMIKPDAGKATVAGFDVVAAPLEVKKGIGYVPESAAIYESLSAREYLDLMAALHHLPTDATRARIEDLLTRFELSAAMDQRLTEFSKGMKQKVLIVSALLLVVAAALPRLRPGPTVGREALTLEAAGYAGALASIVLTLGSAAHTAAVLSVAGKLPTSPLTSSDKSVAGSLPYLVALVLDSPTFQLR